MSNKEGIYSNTKDAGAPDDGSILVAEQARENARSTPGAFHVPGPDHEAGPHAGLPLAPAEGERDVVVENATVYHDNTVLGMIRDENCTAYIYGRKFNLFILILPCLAAAIGACIVIPLGILDLARSWNRDKYTKESDSHSGSESRYEEIRKVVSSVSTSESLDDMSSPQNRALEWLCFHDELELPSTEQEKITQRYTLAVLYYSLGGSDWTVDCDFLSAAHECDWFDVDTDASSVKGVTDCNEDLKVTAVMIYWNNMHGAIPDEVQSLASLEHLTLVGGPLHGTIPDGIGNLVNLTNLHLMENRLSGTVPESLSKLINLEYASLSINENLTGDLDFLCPLENMINMSADCGGADLKVTCSCCDSCCAATEHECCVVKSLPWADIGYCFPTLPPALQDVDNPFSD
mmetsp:Transcript_48204/g.72889  ORF Transcript_48204/g.72889 Transcript_48204/m.72889 type:complete len:405 (-) Transcript_48204:158-1372(-)